ncbi:MAG: FxSxx-COOH system tetratricopeptide repeat protein [Terriglobia bacterium]|jgi:tetratricopeptide (TPR) repeat protein
MSEAPKVFISYTHDSVEHMDRVLALSNRLRSEGIDCSIDQYEQSPAEGWPLWCERQVEKSDFVLVACTETYLRRFKREEAPGVGLGATWEGHFITQELYNAQGRNIKFIPIIFLREDAAHTPFILQGVTRYTVPDAYELLYRRLTHQPRVTMPPLGGVKPMPARDQLPSLPELERRQDFLEAWTVPYPRNPFFTGREKILEDLRSALESRGRAALSGLGGVGKTQTATEYAYRHRKEYQSVFWARAESQDTLLRSFVAIATALRLPESTAQKQEEAVAAVRRSLEANPGWLLVLDNADDLALARDFIPRDTPGHILLTTRAQATSVIAERVEIQKMEAGEGALFLLRRAGIIPRDAPTGAASEGDRQLAEQISSELGGLALALDQAGAFIEEAPSSLAEYLDFYRSERSKLLAERVGLGDHPSVSVTFSLAFKKVAEASAAAADLVRLCAFLAPDAIPEEIFTEGAAELGENLAKVRTPLDFAQVVREAGRHSLIERNPSSKTLDIHRLVQAVVRDGIEKAEQRQWAERAVRAVNLAFADVEFSTWPKCGRVLPHAQACASFVDEFGFEFAEAARLFNKAGYYLQERARYSEAEPLYQRALGIREKVLGPEHPGVATSLNNLAELYYAQGKYSEAEPLHERALGILEKALGPEHPHVASSLNNLAELYRAQGKYAEAEPLYQRALGIKEKALGPDHPDVAAGLNNLAELYRAQGKYAEAEPLYQRALGIREKALEPEHPDVATSLNNLAELYRAQGKYAGAEPLYQRALGIKEKALEPEHPDVATSLNNLAILYYAQGKYAEAEPLLQRAQRILEKALGPEHPDVATSFNNLAELYRTQGKYAEAEPLHQRALGIREKALGPEHPDVATSLNNLGLVYRAQGKYAEAEPLHQRAQRILEKALGPEHPNVAQALENYALLLRQTGRESQAAEMEARAKAIRARRASQSPS